ncbi:hypothetical protein HJP15_17585 [Pseudoalteromonas sp. NEC-BIFX-2020_002]|uniref:Uncharacterized protein n=1 Tax=Pseudoalteromonas neustonica TaxID=1840331 RepID=A0ABU9U759_9GAMM|nr:MULTISPECIES: hypothetical protein [Pseudoalteromonas]NNG44709.1 hypothetical protein [Pseudoalteromonas sp. NEC-BIFX-2020_002]
MDERKKEKRASNAADNFVLEQIKNQSNEFYQQYLSDLQEFAKGYF